MTQPNKNLTLTATVKEEIAGYVKTSSIQENRIDKLSAAGEHSSWYLSAAMKEAGTPKVFAIRKQEIAKNMAGFFMLSLKKKDLRDTGRTSQADKLEATTGNKYYWQCQPNSISAQISKSLKNREAGRSGSNKVFTVPEKTIKVCDELLSKIDKADEDYSELKSKVLALKEEANKL